MASDGIQQQDRLRTELTANASPADPDGEGIHCHEDFERESIHAIRYPYTERSALFSS
jgi:hypothetical protein